MEEIKIFKVENEEGRKAVIVKIPRPIELIGATGEKELIEPIYLLGYECGSDNVKLVYSPDFPTVNFAHPNLTDGAGTAIFNEFELLEPVDGYKKGHIFNNIKLRHFCNPVVQCQLYDEPELIANIVSMQLEEPNPSNAYSDSNKEFETYVYPSRKDKVIKCSSCHSVIKSSDDNKIGMILGLCPHCFSRLLKTQPHIIRERMLTTGHYAKLLNQGVYKHLKNKPRKLEKYSTYYPIINMDEVDINNLIPIESVDLLLLGCGSAGSNIIDQLSRTTMINSYYLIDFDTIERKNLRNQTYIENQIGYNKVSALANNITSIKCDSNVQGYHGKFQEINYDFYKFKYVVLAFDSIDTRYEAFLKIQSGEIKTDYIIDTRYKDLDCSIYFIDTSDEKQMSYYLECLLQDKETLNKSREEDYKKLLEQDKIEPFLTKDRLEYIWKASGAIYSGCSNIIHRLTSDDICFSSMCASNSCINGLYEVLKNKSVKEILEAISECKHLGGEYVTKIILELPELKPSDVPTMLDQNSCYHNNIIDVYKFASCFVTSSIREIFSNRPKQFTHVEINTSGIPKAMVIME